MQNETSSEAYAFHHLRQGRFDFELLLKLLGQFLSWSIFTMCQDHARFARGHGAEPVEEVGLAGMSTKTAECVNFGFHRYFFAVDADQLCAFDQAASE